MAGRRNPALYVGLPAFALLLGAAGAFAAVSLTKGHTDSRASSGHELAQPVAPLVTAEVPTSTTSLAPTPTAPSSTAALETARPAPAPQPSAKRLAPAARPKSPSPRPRRKADDFGF